MIFNRLRYIVIILCIAFVNTTYSQTTIFSDPGPYSYTGIDVPASETFNADVSNCTSVSISYDFEFSLPWEGSGNMETCDECPGCACDPDNSVASGCTPCWDFLHGVMQIGGSVVFEDLIGDTGTTDADQSGTVTSGYICTDGATSVDLELTTNTWAGDETSTFSNIVIMCFEADATDIDIAADLCAGQDVDLDGEAFNNADVDSWSWSSDGSSVFDNDASQNTFAAGAVDGETFTLTTTDVNGCSSMISETISLNPSPEASIDQSSDGELCFGECTTIKFDFIGGTEPYDLDLTFTITGIGFPINFNSPGFAASDEITICYDITGIFPAFDPGSQTISVPEIAAGFSGNFVLNSFTDADGCDGVVNGGGFVVSFLDTPEANFASLEACDEGGGMATFDLTEMDNDVNGGSGETVRYYDDPGLTTELFSPLVSPSSVLYATVSNADCESPAEEVELIVLDSGDAGIVEIYCTDIGSTDCTICDADGVAGEVVTILFVFNDPTVEHTIKLNLTFDSGSSEDTFTLDPNETSITYNITGDTTFELLEVTEGDGCLDDTDLGGIVNVTYLVAPELDPIGPLTNCGDITLPAITGTNLSGSELYYSESNQGGDSYASGTIITESINLFVYSGVPECFDEIMVEVVIGSETVFDQPSDTLVCGPFTLPEITGVGAIGGASYNTLPGGTGVTYLPGEIIISATTLYIYKVSQCDQNEPSFTITFYTPSLDTIESIDTCDVIVLPEITGVIPNGTAAYYSEPFGLGDTFLEGDTVFVSDTLYPFYISDDELCSAWYQLEIVIGEGPTAGVGDSINICSVANPLIVNLPMLLIEPADTLGMWSDDMGIIMDDTDSTQVDLTGITGIINFMYVIENVECGNDTSHLQINVQEQLDAGGENILSGCENDLTTIDLNGYWNIVGVNDTIIVLGGAVIDVADPSIVDISMLDAGLYNLQYIVGITDAICSPDTANLTIEIFESPDAGDNVSTTTCAGNIIDLENVLENNTAVGTFGDPSATGALSGSMVNTGILGVGTYTFIHSVPGNANCPSDLINIEVEVTNDVTAGNNVLDTICYATEINLFDYLDGASLGGTFLNTLNGNVVIPDGILTIDQWSSLPPGTTIMLSATYTVGDNIDCAESSALIELLILPEPSFDLQVIQNTICGDTLNIEIDYAYYFDFEFTLVINGSLPELPISIPYSNFDPELPAFGTLPIQIDLAPYNLPSGIEYSISISSVTLGDCISDINSTPASFSIGAQETMIFNDVICGGEDVEYGGMIFNAANPSGEIIIPRPGQCDSIIIVDLTIADPASSLIDNTLCTGQSVMLGGFLYDESNPSGSFILFGASANGCDSTVVIELVFSDVSINNVVENICEGEEVVFNSIIYDQNNLMGSDTIIGGSAGGCDSIINVNLTLSTTEIGMEMATICDPAFNLEVNGVLFNLNNPVGSTTILGGSVNGCDSTVMVDITFLDPATGLEDGSICPGESIVVNGTTYDEDLLIGTQIFTGLASNGCDSIVSINLTLLEIPEGDFINSSCDETYALTINGNTYDINNPTGTSIITGGASNGCDSLANIQLTFDGISAISSVAQPDCNDNGGSVTITSINGTAPFFWSQPGDTVVEITEFPYIVDGLTGSGALELIDTDGCETMVSYTITDFTTPVLSSQIIDNQIIVSGISLDDINTIIWSPAAGLNCIDCLDPIYVISEDTEYTITINYSDDCEVTLTIPVMAEEIPITPTYTIPNVFSPNGDGINDVFYIVPNDAGSNQIVSMRIYDRWGNQVFNRENYINEIGVGWDGTFKGQELNPGVYVYLIEVLENDVIKPFYGDVTIVK